MSSLLSYSSKPFALLVVFVTSFLVVHSASAENPVKKLNNELADALQIEQCMRDLVIGASPEQTVADLEAVCKEQIKSESVLIKQRSRLPEPRDTALERRIEAEESTELNPFVITAHRPSYVMPITYNSTPNSKLLDYRAREIESVFQLSFKMPLWIDAFGSGADLYFAYTGKSYWQLYKEANSRPFRETNHEPELFVDFDIGRSYFDIELASMQIGFAHQSNGRDGLQSRSWNRVFLSMQLGWKNVFVQVKPWIRLQEDARENPSDVDGDDNPNIERFVGQAEILAAWRIEHHTISAVWRNNFRADNRGSIELGYSFPVNDRLRGYVMYFNGYGESLIDYDESSNRIGVGVLLTDWL